MGNQHSEVLQHRKDAYFNLPTGLSAEEQYSHMKSKDPNLFPSIYSFLSFKRRVDNIKPQQIESVVRVEEKKETAISSDWQQKILKDKGVFKTLWFSDPHGWLFDPKATGVINKVLQANKFDEVGINGDIVDLPYLSRHTARLLEDGILSGYSEVKEIEHTKAAILEPLRNSTDAKIRIRLGNHDERITNPLNLGHNQSNRLLMLGNHYQSNQLDVMLDIKSTDGYIYDPSSRFTYFDKFDVFHGLSLVKSASRKNINDCFSSGGSGHTHRLGATYITNRTGSFVWVEMGCTRLIQQAEYLPTGVTPDWQQGFIEVTFTMHNDRVLFFVEPHVIVDGVCKYNGVVYRA